MILATFIGKSGIASIGVVNRADSLILDLKSAATSQARNQKGFFDGMLSLIEAGDRALETARQLVERIGWSGEAIQALADVKLLAPVPVPTQIRDFSVTEQHVRQAGAAIARMRAQRLGLPPPDTTSMAAPEVIFRQPIYYKGNRLSVIGPGDNVQWPRYCAKLDYELEFGIFLSRRGKNIPVEQARQYIFGYTVFNDFSARDAQEVEMSGFLGPAKGKDFDTGNAMGPWIVTPDEIENPYNLTMTGRVNGEVWSSNNSSAMLHTFEEMIAFVSRDETLFPGEFFGSGTVGNGCGLELDRWIRPGDLIELEVQGIGVLRNRVISGTHSNF